ncbi:YcxB family protein [Pinibacter soli]|uniref:YcxB family protein n=1 Tax=Pinibacter soli TaxID=3044211 RepID=A0ABT6RIP9_9BACT|nr:YcxB family protein [Pinibacter soli]MDI3322444.1 YcxB family protein [Pinibacter soli]
MTIHFNYNKKQVIQGLRYHFFTRPEIKFLIIIINVFALLSAGLFYFKKIQPVSFLIFSLLWLVLMVVIWSVLPASIYRRAHTFKDEFSVDFKDDGLTLSNDRGSKKWEWNLFSNFLETPYFFHLYFDARSFFLIPKDAFKDLPDMQTARSLLKEHIKA